MFAEDIVPRRAWKPHERQQELLPLGRRWGQGEASLPLYTLLGDFNSSGIFSTTFTI